MAGRAGQGRSGRSGRARARVREDQPDLARAGRAPDGYHELRTTFQSIALHDTLTFTQHADRVRPPGSMVPMEIVCDDPACPVDRTNLVWRAADAMWRAAGRRGDPSGLRVRLVKRIPMQAGLGGGSSDAPQRRCARAPRCGVSAMRRCVERRLARRRRAVFPRRRHGAGPRTRRSVAAPRRPDAVVGGACAAVVRREHEGRVRLAGRGAQEGRWGRSGRRRRCRGK